LNFNKKIKDSHKNNPKKQKTKLASKKKKCSLMFFANITASNTNTNQRKQKENILPKVFFIFIKFWKKTPTQNKHK